MADWYFRDPVHEDVYDDDRVIREAENRLILVYILPKIWAIDHTTLYVDGVGYNKNWWVSCFDFGCWRCISQFLNSEHRQVKRLRDLFSAQMWSSCPGLTEKFYYRAVTFSDIECLLLTPKTLSIYVDCQKCDTEWWNHAEQDNTCRDA
ncbi:TPA_asm: P10 [Picris trirhavirus 1]|nr:TPA_asm: P10 [Picris trirhavirus 1]